MKEEESIIRFLLSDNTRVVNVVLLFSVLWIAVLSTIAVIMGWIRGELVVDIILMVIGSFLGASLLKYGLKKK